MTVPVLRSSTSCCIAPGTRARVSGIKIQTATGSRSRAAARGELLFSLPSTLRGDGAERRALVTVPQLVSRIAENQRLRKRLPTLPRGDFCSWDRSSGRGREHKPAIQAGFPALHPSRPAIEGRAPLVGPDDYPRPPGSMLARHVRGRRIRHGLGYPAPAKLSLCPTSERLMKRPLVGQDSRLYIVL